MAEEWGKCTLLYAIIALVALAGLSAWLIWRCVTLRRLLTKSRARCQELQRDRAIRQNLQQVLERREAEIRRLRSRMASFESDYHEMETRASDLNVSLFRESGLRILAEKEDGAKRLKMEQLEKQVSDARRRLKEQQDEAAETVRRMQDLITSQEKEIARLRQANARRLKKSAAEPALANQVTLEEILVSHGDGSTDSFHA
ncbi:MAG: hypothetical protein IKQ80_08925 [Clostridia bacterium]|nr:hypothetical protein [Clostridia bacterium]